MTAKIGTVTLPYGVQGENETTGEIIAVNNVPTGSPIVQLLGRQASQITLKATVTPSIYTDLITQQDGAPMVTFNAGGTSDSDYGIIIESIDKSRDSKLPNCLELDIRAYKLDFDVENLSYDLTDGDYALGVSSQLITDNTDEVIDGYTSRLVLSSTEECSFYVQTSPNTVTWTSYPDDLGWVLTKERRVIDVSHLTGYLRVVGNNTGSSATTISIDFYMSKQE